jgi:hypothetical protein
MYSIHSRSYVRRARLCLDAETSEGLFYAALELRCGIEARLQEYLEPHDHIPARQKTEYHIKRLGRSVGGLTHPDEQIVKCTVVVESAEVFALYYTPVREALRRAGERLGDLLHAPRKHREETDRWWRETRTFLEETWTELSKACLGELLGSPLLQKESGAGTVHMVVDDEARRRIGQHLLPGKQMVVHVELSDDYPAELLARLHSRA